MKTRGAWFFLFWLLAGLISGGRVSLAEDFSQLNLAADSPLVILVDELPDDLASIVAMARKLRPSLGRNVLFVTVDADAHTKAKARHFWNHLYGLSQAQVVAGNAEPQVEIDYVHDYLDPQHKEYLRRLAAMPGVRTWVPQDYRRAIREFFARHERVRVWYLGNPLSFTDVQDSIDPAKVDHGISMGLWGTGAGGKDFTKFNGHVDISATVKLLDWYQRNGRPLFMIPSQFYADVDLVGTVIQEPRKRMYDSPVRRGVLNEFLEYMRLFGKDLADRIVRKYGTPQWADVWDPRSREWYQDLLTVKIAQNPQKTASWKPVRVRIDTTQRDTLGFPVAVNDDSDSSVFVATQIDIPRLAAELREDYESVKLTPDFDPQAEIDLQDTTPIAMVGMPAIDVMGGLASLLGLEDRLKLVIAESGPTALSAEIFRKYVRGYGREDIAVVAGSGHTIAEMEQIDALWLEALLARNGKMAAGFLSPAEVARITDSNQTSSGGAALIEFLRQHERVDITNFATLDALYEVATQHPELLYKIRTLHIMGGIRGGKKNENDAVEWTQGDATRNWVAIDPAKTAAVFKALERHRVQTIVYSSHVAGGTLNRHRVPLVTGLLDSLQKQMAVEKARAQARVAWSEALASRIKGLDTQDNYGPRLGWILSAIAAMGTERASTHFTLIHGKFSFHGTKVDFARDEDSTIRLLVDIEDGVDYANLDGVSAYLHRRAEAHRSLPTRLVGRVQALWQTCRDALRGQK